jgi:hypothetical protein
VEIGGQKGNPDNPAMDDTSDNDDKKTKRSKRQKSPIKLKYLVPMMKTVVMEWPNISNKEMTTILKPCVNNIFITNTLLQKTCSDVGTLLFGDPSESIQL